MTELIARLIEREAVLLHRIEVLQAEVKAWRHHQYMMENTFPGQDPRFVAWARVLEARKETDRMEKP